jgi:hypothetical protein
MNVALGESGHRRYGCQQLRPVPSGYSSAGLALSSIYQILRDYDHATRFFLMDQQLTHFKVPSVEIGLQNRDESEAQVPVRTLARHYSMHS